MQITLDDDEKAYIEAKAGLDGEAAERAVNLFYGGATASAVETRMKVCDGKVHKAVVALWTFDNTRRGR